MAVSASNWNRKMKFLSCLVAALNLICCCGCNDGGSSSDSNTAASKGNQSATLALNWYAEAEHGGYIAAKESGLYEQAGVDMTIEPGGPGAPNQVILDLATGRIQFAISNADMVVLGRSKEIPLVAVAAPLQHSPRCIMVHESSGIESLKELSNVELAISESRPFALWMKKKLPLTNVTMVPFAGQVGEFVLNEKFAQQGYVFSEPFTAAEKGSDPRVLLLSEIDFDPYASLLVTTEDVIRSNPELVRQVVGASIEGWRRYLKNPDATNKAIHTKNKDMSMEALAFGVDAMRPLCGAEDSSLCEMSIERWQTLISQIEEVGEIDSASVAAEACFTNDFLVDRTAK